MSDLRDIPRPLPEGRPPLFDSRALTLLIFGCACIGVGYVFAYGLTWYGVAALSLLLPVIGICWGELVEERR